MKIKRVVASNFGCLSGSYDFFDDRANVVVEENESGKSTLVAAVLAGLYGLPPSRPREKLSERETYQPWKGGPYRVQLEVEDDKGRPMRIDRDFAEGKLKVTDLSTNKDVTQEFRVGKSEFAVGDRLLGISREVFLKTCLVKQLEIETVAEKPSELVSKVQQIFDTSGGRGTAAAAISVLKRAVEKYRGKVVKEGKVENEIIGLKEKTADCERWMRVLVEERQKAAPTMVKLHDLRDEIEKLEARRGELEYLAPLAEIKELEGALKDDAENRSALDNLIKQRESLREYSDFPKEKAAEFARLVGRLEALRKQRKQVASELDDLKRDLEAKHSALKKFEGFEVADENFRTRLHGVRADMSRLDQDVTEKRRLIADFESRLKGEGYALSEIQDLSSKFLSLSVQDNDFLRDSEKETERTRADLLELDKTEASCREKLRAVRRPGQVLLAFGLLLCVAGAAAMVAGALKTGAVVGALGIGGFVFALFLMRRREVNEILRNCEQVGDKRSSLLSERAALNRMLEEMRYRAGFGTTDELSQAFKRWGRLEGRYQRLESMRKDLGQAETQLSSANEAASGELRKIGLNVPPAEVDVAVLENAEKRVGEYLDAVSSVRQLEETRGKLESQIGEVDREARALRESISGILVAAKLPPELPIEEAGPKVEEARQKCEEFHRLNSRDIPERQRTIFPPEKVSAMGQRLESLKRETGEMLSEQPEFSKLLPLRTHSEYQEESRKTAKDIENKKEEKRQLLREVERVEEKYREEYPRLANELAELSQILDSTERFQKSISMAIETLGEISSASHARWATVLNERANEILRRLNPRCRELKFDRDLSFTVVPAEGGEPKDQRHINAQQSVGARHQIYLAVRLALTDYLSSATPGVSAVDTYREREKAPPSSQRAVSLPVILDDPFATSDDERFLSGMAFICREFRKRHQVIVLTCHRQRHSDLIRQKSPDLSEEMRILQIATSP